VTLLYHNVCPRQLLSVQELGYLQYLVIKFLSNSTTFTITILKKDTLCLGMIYKQSKTKFVRTKGSLKLQYIFEFHRRTVKWFHITYSNHVCVTLKISITLFDLCFCRSRDMRQSYEWPKCLRLWRDHGKSDKYNKNR